MVPRGLSLTILLNSRALCHSLLTSVCCACGTAFRCPCCPSSTFTRAPKLWASPCSSYGPMSHAVFTNTSASLAVAADSLIQGPCLWVSGAKLTLVIGWRASAWARTGMTQGELLRHKTKTKSRPTDPCTRVRPYARVCAPKPFVSSLCAPVSCDASAVRCRGGQWCGCGRQSCRSPRCLASPCALRNCRQAFQDNLVTGEVLLVPYTPCQATQRQLPCRLPAYATCPWQGA